ncbi:MAG: hypothetical protein R3E08_07055 [Thiotrichaceae bacterium]
MPDSQLFENVTCPTGLDEGHVAWGVLVVDDEEDIHRITRLVPRVLFIKASNWKF